MGGRDALRRGCGIASTRMSVARRTCAERVFSAQRAWKMSRRMQPQHFGLEQRHGSLLGVDTTGERRAGLRNGRWFRCCAFAHAPVLAGVWLRARDVRIRGAGRPAAHPCAGGSRPVRASAAASRASPFPAPPCGPDIQCAPQPSRGLRPRGLRSPPRDASSTCGNPPKPLVSQAFRPSRHGGKYRRKASHGLRWRSPRRRTLRA
jgi:hypothetical protein